MKGTIVNRTWYHHQLTNPQISFHQPIKISWFELKKDTVVPVTTRLDYQPLFGKMSPHSSPERALFSGRIKDRTRETAEIEPSYNWLGKRLYHDLIETFNSKGSGELVRSTRKRMRVVRGRKQTWGQVPKKCFSFRQLYFLGPPLYLFLTFITGKLERTKTNERYFQLFQTLT